MLHRKWFFWIDRLKISKAERVLMVTLIGIAIAIALFSKLVHFHSPYGDTDYKKLDAFFEQRTKLLSKKRAIIEARYKGKKAESSSLDPSKTTTQKVDINKAGLDALQTLPGIGPALAGRIIAYRERQGTFGKVSELDKVKGIGSATLKKICPLVRKIGGSR